MANNSIPNGTKVRHYELKHSVQNGGFDPEIVSTGIVVAQSRLGEEWVIVEWDGTDAFPVSSEHVDDLEIIDTEDSPLLG